MVDLDKIKQLINIVDVANYFGCDPIRKGGVFVLNNNPLRDDGKNKSFTLYPDTNTFTDFGGDQISGDIVKFVEIVKGCDFKEAVKILNEDFLRNDVVTVAPKKKQQSKLTEHQVKEMFKQFKPIDLTVKAQQEHLKGIIPEWLPNDCNEDDWAYFLSIARWCTKEQSMVFKLSSFNSTYLTYKYRYKKFPDEVRKWVACAGSKADYLYCNLKHDNKIVLVVEGARDMISAFLCGYDVIAIPRASYKIDNKVFNTNKTYIFIDDDDGKQYMKPIFDDAKCTKIYFNHAKFKELTACKSKDLSDYLYQFESLQHFKIMFDEFIEDSLNLDWKDLLFNVAQPITLKEIEEAQNQEFLYPELIIQQNITTIVSPPNTGKSALVFGLSQSLLNDNKIENVFFLDPDSNLSYVKSIVEKMTNNYNGKFNYYNGVKSTVQDMLKMLETMSTLPKGKGNKSLIICDGLQFFSKGTISDDTTSKDFLELLKLVRDRFGATIILLHHTKKDKDEKGEHNYIGSQFIEAATDNMILLSSKNKKLSAYIKKSRSDKKDNIYEIEIDFKEKEILNVEFIKNKNDNADDEEEESDIEVNENNLISFMKGKDWLSRTEINKHFKATRPSRKKEKEKMNDIFTLLRDIKDIEWNRETERKARYRYIGIENKPIEVEFQDTEGNIIDMPNIL